MTIIKTTKRVSVAERPQRRRSGLKAAPTPAAGRPGRRAPTTGRTAAAAAAGGAQASNVRVVVRVRPENDRERQGAYRLVVRPLDDHMLIFDPRQQDEDFYFQGVRQRQRDLNKRASKDMQYMFDRVFHPHHNNQQLFEATTKDVIDTVIEGFNCSVFAYGSTGAGKTHTMLGTSAEPGIIFLTVMELYSRIAAMTETRCQVAVSYVEVYNETVTDLLQPSGPLDVREDGQRAVVIAGLSQSTPDGPDHLMTILEAGNKNRTQHPTDMNAESSRSHAVFQVVLRQSDSTAGLSTDVRVSKLSLIDLAGSERGSATGHKGARFREGANINRSLLALGSCINALADGKKFVPYRDSKLTRLLKDSIGGNCKTVMIANVTPSAASFEDTHNTLKYADRAKAIKTRLQRNVVSVDMHVAQYAKVVDELRQEVAELKAQLAERPVPAEPAAAPAEPPFDAAPLRSAETARRTLVTRQLQLEAEAQQLRLRLHRRRLCVQRAALLRPGGAARPDRQQDRLAGRLSQAHTRLERARGELAEAVQRAEAEAGRAPPGPATDQLTDQLGKERQLDECRVHAAHLEAFSRLLQLELASSDHLLAQLITAFREQYRVLGYMKFVTPELEAQYKEVVGLVEGQKEVCWADQQQPAAESPGQPSYDVTALLRLADTTYQPAEPARHAIGGLLASAALAPAGRLRHTSSEESRSTPGGGLAAVAAAVDSTLLPPGLDATPPSLSAVQPPGDTTLGSGADDEVLIPGGVAAGEETPCRPRHQRPASPVFFDAEPGPQTPLPAGRAEAGEEGGTNAGPEREAAGEVTAEGQVSPGPVQADRELAEEAVIVPSRPELHTDQTRSPVNSTTAAAAPAAPHSQLPETDTEPDPNNMTALSSLSTSTATDVSEAAYDAEISSLRGVARSLKTARSVSPPPPAAGRRSPGLDATRTMASPEVVGPGSPVPTDPGSTVSGSPGVCVNGARLLPAGVRRSVSPNLNTTVTVSPSDSKSASPDLNATVTMPASQVRKSASPDLNATVTMPASQVRKSASPDLNATVTMPASQVRKSASPDLNATVTLPASQVRKSASPDLNATVTMPASQVRKSASPDLNATVTMPASQVRKSASPDLNWTVTVPAAGRRRSPAAVDSGRAVPAARRSPPAAPEVNLNATRTLSPAAPLSSAALPSFDSSPIRPHPAAAAAALCVSLPPDLPPTPEILRRTRTPLKARTAAAKTSGAAGMDSTFTMQPPPFRPPSATDGGGGGGAAAGGGGQRAVAGKAAVRGAPSTAGTQLATHRTGLSRSASSVHVSQAARGGGGSGCKRPTPGSGSRRGHEVSARLAATAPNPGRLSLSAQKARSTSRLHTSASGGRDENQLADRPAWGRTAPLASSAGADKAAGRHDLISSVGEFGLGRNRKGGMTKSRSEAVLRPANR